MVEWMTVVSLPTAGTDWWANLTSGGLGALAAGLAAWFGVSKTIKSQNTNLTTTYERQQTMQREQFEHQQTLLRAQFDRQELDRRREQAVSMMDMLHDAALEVSGLSDRPIPTSPDVVIDSADRLMRALTKAVSHVHLVGLAPISILKDCAVHLDAAREACLPDQSGLRKSVPVQLFANPARVASVVASKWMLERGVPPDWTFDRLLYDLDNVTLDT